MRFGALTMLTGCTVLLQGCAAAILPVAAAGVIGKTQVGAARMRTQAAEQQVAALPETARAAVVSTEPADIASEAEVSPDSALALLAAAGINHPYLPMARYALAQAQRRQAGTEVRSAVLVEQVSLIEPRAVDCSTRPFAILIDMDEAPGVVLSDGEATGFGELLDLLRANGIAIAWLSDRPANLLDADLATLRAGAVPALRDGDIELFAYPGLRKQEHRWNLAATHCVLAIAGDSKSDFDELFGYLRDPDYAIRLDAWIDKGWFLLPYPLAVVTANPSPQAPEVENTP